MIRPIETLWRGYRFRSRLEARWAVFFHEFGIRWEYEPEGFVLSTGEHYLPDFLLHCENGQHYVEVKPLPTSDFSKAVQFSKDQRVEVLFLDGPPETNRNWPSSYWDGDKYRLSESCFCKGRVWGGPGEPGEGDWDRNFLRAVYVARGARFEFGERP